MASKGRNPVGEGGGAEGGRALPPDAAVFSSLGLKDTSAWLPLASLRGAGAAGSRAWDPQAVFPPVGLQVRCPGPAQA